MSLTTEDFQNQYNWINNDLFQRILTKEHERYTVKVLNYDLKLALKPGENYASQMIRARVYFTKQDKNSKGAAGKKCEISFIVKAIIRNEVVQELMEEINVFEKEILIYEHVLPAVEQLLFKIGECGKLAPKYIGPLLCYIIVSTETM